MRLVARILLNGLALVIAAHLLDGIHWTGGLGALIVAGCVIGLLNAIVKPIVTVLSCPLIVLTLFVIFVVSILLSPRRSVLVRAIARTRARAALRAELLAEAGATQ